MKDIEKVIKISESFDYSHGQGWGPKRNFSLGIYSFSFHIDPISPGIGTLVTLPISFLDKTGPECVEEWLRLEKIRIEADLQRRNRVSELSNTPEVKEYKKLTETNYYGNGLWPFNHAM